MTNALKPKSLIHIVMCRPSLIFIYMFYQVKWIKEPQKEGYYLTKRIWVWFLILPFILIGSFLMAIYSSINEIFSYNMHWIGSEKRKLSFREKLYYGDKLFH
jgi:hypothetical protein